MDNAMTPREIQARIRTGASVDDVAAESGMDRDRIEAFAGPVLAEREHIAGAARGATIRRRGEAGSHRRLADLIASRLRSRGIDSDAVTWDAWRQADLKWRVVATLGGDSEARTGEFVFDPKARFSVADNADARWMIGEELPGAKPEDENTIDLDDELALVRAVTRPTPKSPGDDVPASELMHEANEDTSQLDRLYDMLSGISEDSVRIYTGILDPVLYEDPVEPPAGSTVDDEADEPTRRVPLVDPDLVEDGPDAEEEPPVPSPVAEEPSQEPLVDSDEEPKRPPKPRKRRAKVPSWDEIMFGGPTP